MELVFIPFVVIIMTGIFECFSWCELCCLFGNGRSMWLFQSLPPSFPYTPKTPAPAGTELDAGSWGRAMSASSHSELIAQREYTWQKDNTQVLSGDVENFCEGGMLRSVTVLGASAGRPWTWCWVCCCAVSGTSRCHMAFAPGPNRVASTHQLRALKDVPVDIIMHKPA